MLSRGRAAAELAERGAHVPSESVCVGVGLDDDHLMPVRMPGRRQQADARQHLGFAPVLDIRRAGEVAALDEQPCVLLGALVGHGSRSLRAMVLRFASRAATIGA